MRMKSVHGFMDGGGGGGRDGRRLDNPMIYVDEMAWHTFGR